MPSAIKQEEITHAERLTENPDKNAFSVRTKSTDHVQMLPYI
jgi:hypothetical protein